MPRKKGPEWEYVTLVQPKRHGRTSASCLGQAQPWVAVDEDVKGEEASWGGGLLEGSTLEPAVMERIGLLAVRTM
eukprot:1151932-Pelagomonas_calceolata.AAC.4